MGIRVEVWDHDYTSRHDFMGYLILDPSLYKINTTYDNWYKLSPENGEYVSGDIRIIISTSPK